MMLNIAVPKGAMALGNLTNIAVQNIRLQRVSSDQGGYVCSNIEVAIDSEERREHWQEVH